MNWPEAQSRSEWSERERQNPDPLVGVGSDPHFSPLIGFEGCGVNERWGGQRPLVRRSIWRVDMERWCWSQ